MVVILSVYMVADFVNKADEFMEADLSFMKMMLCFVAQMPLEQFIPASVLLSILVILGLMNKNNEMLALKSSGVSHWRIVKSILGIGIGISLLLFVASEFFFPLLRAEANRIWNSEVEKDRVVEKQRNIWIKENRFIYHFSHFDPVHRRLYGITINEFDADFRLIRRVNAETAVYADDKWLLSGVMEQLLDPSDGSFRVEIFDEKPAGTDLRPEDLDTVARSSDEMGLIELSRYIDKVESEGYDANSYRVDWHAKLAFPVMGLMLCFLGGGIALGKEKSLSIPMLVLSGIGVAFGYWVVRSFCISLAYGDMLNPMVAAWFPNLLFFVSGIFLLLRTN